nr:MAG TPA: hypothetical protein [Bacteriophage sp.]
MIKFQSSSVLSIVGIISPYLIKITIEGSSTILPPVSNAWCIKRLLYEISRVGSIISCRLYTLVILIEWVKRKEHKNKRVP